MNFGCCLLSGCRVKVCEAGSFPPGHRCPQFNGRRPGDRCKVIRAANMQPWRTVGDSGIKFGDGWCGGFGPVRGGADVENVAGPPLLPSPRCSEWGVVTTRTYKSSFNQFYSLSFWSTEFEHFHYHVHKVVPDMEKDASGASADRGSFWPMRKFGTRKK